ncbi:ENR1 protein, partial [Mohoua ochrocephala]|nr:ENR1 protein [Mohoua ochrocephala]
EELEAILHGENLFIDMVERISNEFNISGCWVCGGTEMAEMWPWEGESLSPQAVLKWMRWRQSSLVEGNWRGPWTLKAKMIGEECLWRKG